MFSVIEITRKENCSLDEGEDTLPQVVAALCAGGVSSRNLSIDQNPFSPYGWTIRIDDENLTIEEVERILSEGGVRDLVTSITKEV